MVIVKWGLGTLDQVEYLLENGADPDIRYAQGGPALHLLAQNNAPDADFRREATSLLLYYGADAFLREDSWDVPRTCQAQRQLRGEGRLAES